MGGKLTRSASSDGIGPKAPSAPNLEKHNTIKRLHSLTKRVITNHGTAQVKRKEKHDMRKSFAKARLDVRLQRRKSMSKPPPDKGSSGEDDKLKSDKSKRRLKKEKSKRKISKSKSSKKIKMVPWPVGWSKLGVSMRFLHNMFSRIEPHTTTRQLVEYIVIQETTTTLGSSRHLMQDVQHAGSYVEYLKLKNHQDFHGNSVVGEATHYVSHAWDSPFIELISALDVMITTKKLNPAKTFFWIDIFSISQHVAHQNQVDENNDVEIKTRDAIRNVEGVILILSSWKAPLALSRTWCLWEILCSLSAKRPLEIYMPGKAMHELHDALISDFPSISTSLTTIDYTKSNASRMDVQSKILKAIDVVGERRATRALEKAIRTWLVDTSKMVLTELMHNNLTVAPHPDKSSKTKKSSSKGSKTPVSPSKLTRKVQKKALRLAEDLGTFLREKELFDEAENICKTTLSLREILYGKNHETTILALQNLALVMQGKNDMVHAEVFYRRALITQEDTIGSDNPKTLLSVNNFGVFCQKRGNYHEAEMLYRRAIKGFEAKDGEKHAHTLLSMHNLASLLQSRKEYTESEALYRRVLDSRIETLGLKAHLTLQTLHRLGTVCHAAGKSDEAVGIFMCALEGREETLGVEHRQTLQTVSDLGSCLLDGGKTKQAREQFERAYKGRVDILGKHHEETLRSMCDLASVMFQDKEYKESERLQRKSLKGRERILGPKHPDTLTSVSNLAAVCYATGNLKEAEKLYKRALAGFDTTLGRKDPCTLLCVDTLARLLKTKGKLDAAIPLYQRALKGYTETLGPKARDTLNTLGNMGLCLKAAGQVQKGEYLIQKAIEMMNDDNLTFDERAYKKFELGLQQSKEMVYASLIDKKSKKKDKKKSKKLKDGGKNSNEKDVSKKEKKKKKKGKDKSKDKIGKDKSKKKGGNIVRNTSEDNIIVKKDIKKMDNINEKIKIVEKHGTDTEEVKKKEDISSVPAKFKPIKPVMQLSPTTKIQTQPQRQNAQQKNVMTANEIQYEPPMKMPADSTSQTNKVLTVPQTKVFPQANSSNKDGANKNEMPVYDQLKEVEKIAKQCKADALALKSAGDIKGALAKLSEYKKLQLELSTKRKTRIAELRARLSEKNKGISPPPQQKQVVGGGVGTQQAQQQIIKTV